MKSSMENSEKFSIKAIIRDHNIPRRDIDKKIQNTQFREQHVTKQGNRNLIDQEGVAKILQAHAEKHSNKTVQTETEEEIFQLKAWIVSVVSMLSGFLSGVGCWVFFQQSPMYFRVPTAIGLAGMVALLLFTFSQATLSLCKKYFALFQSWKSYSSEVLQEEILRLSYSTSLWGAFAAVVGVFSVQTNVLGLAYLPFLAKDQVRFVQAVNETNNQALSQWKILSEKGLARINALVLQVETLVEEESKTGDGPAKQYAEKFLSRLETQDRHLKRMLEQSTGALTALQNFSQEISDVKEREALSMNKYELLYTTKLEMFSAEIETLQFHFVQATNPNILLNFTSTAEDTIRDPLVRNNYVQLKKRISQLVTDTQQEFLSSPVSTPKFEFQALSGNPIAMIFNIYDFPQILLFALLLDFTIPALYAFNTAAFGHRIKVEKLSFRFPKWFGN